MKTKNRSTSVYRTPDAERPRHEPSVVRLRELPQLSQDFLRTVARDVDRAGGVTRRSSVALALAAGILFAVPVALVPQEKEGFGVVTVCSALTCLFLTRAFATWQGASTSPLGDFWLPYEKYLFEVRGDIVLAYPLAGLTGEAAIGTVVELTFGEHVVRIDFETYARAAGFAARIRGLADDAKSGVERPDEGLPPLIPADLLDRETPVPAAEQAWVMPILAALVGGVATTVWGAWALPVALAVIGGFILVWVREPADRAARADRTGSATPERGRRAKRAASTAAAITRYRANANPSLHRDAPAGIEALVCLIEALRDADAATVAVTLLGGVDADAVAQMRSAHAHRDFGDASVFVEMLDAAAERSCTAIAAAIRSTGVMGVAIFSTVLGRVYRWVETGGADGPKLKIDERPDLPVDAVPVAIDVVLTATPCIALTLEEDPPVGPNAYFVFDFDWTFTFRWRRRPQRAPFVVRLRTRDPGPGPTRSGPTGFYAATLHRAAEDLAPELARVFGFSGE
jgi:hypothetical protein